MRRLRFLLSWVMVFSTCCLALSGGASAAENDYYSYDSISDDYSLSTFGLVVDKPCAISWNDMPWSSTFGSGVLASGATRHPASTSGSYQNIYLGRQINLPIGHGSGIVNISPGTIKFSEDGWATGVTQIKGQIRVGLQWRDNGNSPSGYSQWTGPLKLRAEIWDDSSFSAKIIEAEGGTINIDVTYPNEVEFRGINIYAIFGDNQSIRIEPFNGAIFAWVQMSSTVRLYKGDANVQYQQDVVSGINESNNLLGGIWEGISDLWDAVSSLPSKIADAIKGLFVPTDSQMNELKASFNSLLSEKLGFVYQAGSLVDGVFDAVFDAVDNPNSDVSFTVPAFPSFDVDGTEVSLWEEPVVVDIADNQVVQTVQRVASPFVVAVMVWGFVHSMEDAFLAFVGGKSLADWVRNRKEDTD